MTRADAWATPGEGEPLQTHGGSLFPETPCQPRGSGFFRATVATIRRGDVALKKVNVLTKRVESCYVSRSPDKEADVSGWEEPTSGWRAVTTGWDVMGSRGTSNVILSQ